MESNDKQDKGMKRKAIFGRKFVDSSVPMPELVTELSDIGNGYNKAYNMYWRLICQRRKKSLDCRLAYHFAVPGHPLNRFSENYDGTTYYNYFEEFPYRSLSPKYITLPRHIQKMDPVVAPIKAYVDWKERLCVTRKVFQLMEVKSKIERVNEDVIYCPKYVLDLAAAIEKKATDCIDDSYNWQYAGSGNMHLVQLNFLDYLVYSEFSCIYVSRFHRDTKRIDFENSTTFECGHNILEIICSADNIVAIRTKNKVFILKLNQLEDISINVLSSFESKVLFTSIAFDKHHKNIMYATKLDCSLSIVNLSRMTQKSVQLSRSSTCLENNWNSVIGSTRGTYLHIEKDRITSYDKRTNSAVDSFRGLKGIIDERDCNDITAAVQAEDGHGLYFATEHHLFLMDTRCSQTRKLKVLQRWMHGLQCVPTCITMAKKGNKDFMFITSQWCEDLCVVTNYADRVTRSGELPGVTMPYHLPNIVDVLQKARHKLLCTDLENPIDDRLVTAMTGRVVLDTKDGFTVLMQNSLGDVSEHVLYATYLDTIMEDDSVQKLHEWSKSYKVERKIFEVTGIHDISKLWRKLKRIPDNFTGFPFVNVPKRVVNESEIYASFDSKEELMPELLEAWSVELPLNPPPH